MKRYSLELWVGLFTILGIATALYMVYRKGGFQWSKGMTYTVYVTFPDVAGVTVNDLVRVAGVDVGRVTGIELRHNMGRLALSINKDVPLYRDATAKVKTYGLIGDRYISVDPGHEERAPIPPGGEIRASEPTEDLDALVHKLNGIAGDLKQVTDTIKTVFGGEQGEIALRTVLDNTRELSDQLVRTVKDNQEHFQTLTHHLSTLTGELSGMVAENREAIRRTITALPATAEQLQGITRDTNDLLRTHKEDLSHMLSQLKVASERLDAALKNVEEVTRKINEGEGSLGRLLNDEELYTEAKNTIKEARHLIEDMREQAPISAFISVGRTLF